MTPSTQFARCVYKLMENKFSEYKSKDKTKLEKGLVSRDNLQVAVTSPCTAKRPRIMSTMLQLGFGFAQMSIHATETKRPSFFGTSNKQVRLAFSPAALFPAD